MPQWTAGFNIPGCLPETAPETFDEWHEAHTHIVETVERFWDEDSDDARWLEVHTSLHTATSGEPYAFTAADDHLTVWVELAEPDEGDEGDEVTAQERFVQASLPRSPETATLTSARNLVPGDRITQGRGSRYQGRTFTIASIEEVAMVHLFTRTIPATRNLNGTQGERLTGVPLDFKYWAIHSPRRLS